MNMIEMEQVSKSYQQHQVLNKITLSLPQGHVMAALQYDRWCKTALELAD